MGELGIPPDLGSGCVLPQANGFGGHAGCFLNFQGIGFRAGFYGGFMRHLRIASGLGLGCFLAQANGFGFGQGCFPCFLGIGFGLGF